MFPLLDVSSVRFRERKASGNSLRNLLTKIGGARRAIEVVVVGEELWIRVPYPFSIIFTGAEFELAHRVRLGDIHSVGEVRRFGVGRGFRLVFDDWWGDEKTVELWVRDRDGFRRAIGIV